MPTLTPLSPEKAFSRLQQLCAKSEICSGEARQRLYKWGISPGNAEKIITRLQKLRFIDDRRFAQAFTNIKALCCRWGERKITAALISKGIDRSFIYEALDGIDDEDFDCALTNLLTAKIEAHPELLATSKGKSKLYIYGIRRGYSSSAVALKIRELAREQNLDPDIFD